MEKFGTFFYLKKYSIFVLTNLGFGSAEIFNPDRDSITTSVCLSVCVSVRNGFLKL